MLSLMRSETASRRAVVKALGATGVALAFAGSFALLPRAAFADDPKVPVDQLMAKEALPDIVQGKADAPVTMVEYASMTCPHCAHFHETVYPLLMKNYVDTGKVKFILREFPLDVYAQAAFMLARCEGPDKRSAVVDLLFDKQKDWAYVDKPIEALANLLKQTGMSKESFDACLKDQKLQDAIYEVSERASKQFGVTATPTFFVNGTKVTGEVTPETLAKTLDPLLVKKS